jgi:hypothetical protein
MEGSKSMSKYAIAAVVAILPTKEQPSTRWAQRGTYVLLPTTTAGQYSHCNAVEEAKK